MTVEFATAVPVSVGVVELVMLSVEDAPVSDAVAKSGRPGVATTAIVIVTATFAELAVLPAMSTTVAEKVCVVALKLVALVKLQLPVTSATAVPSTVAPSFTVTVEPGSAVPVNVGLLFVVDEPLTGDVMATAAVVSMVTASPLEAADVLPATSVEVAEMLCTPAASAVPTVKVHAPTPLAVTVPISVAPS